MRIRASRRSTVALAAAATLASTGSAYVGARTYLSGQADKARRVIPKSWDIPPRADGVYSPGGGPVERWYRGVPFDLHLMVFGDSTATRIRLLRRGEEVPGVLIARGLAEESGKRIRLSTKAIVGATSKGLSGQIDAMFVAGPPPDAAVIMIGANDITKPNGIGPSARRLGGAVRRLRASGAVVVVGTCPDFGVITGDSAAAALGGPQPRTAAGARTGRRQYGRRAAYRCRSPTCWPPSSARRPKCCSPMTCSTRPAAGYALAAKQLLPALCNALGEFITGMPSRSALETRSGRSNTLFARLGGVSRLWRRSTGVPAPIVVPAG